jgi:geranylgeranyl reductase family protein
MEDGFDVVVVGAGPAGSACAFGLARAGVSCLLLSGRDRPLGKPCGGAVGRRALDALESRGMASADELVKLAAGSACSLSCYWRTDLLREYSTQGPPVLLMDRASLDPFLSSRAVEAGAHLLAGEPAAEVSTGLVHLRSGRAIRCGAVVGADGADSLVRRCSGAGRPRGGSLGMEYFIPRPASFPDGIRIHFGLTEYGYAWVFPRERDVCAGIGSSGRHDSPAAMLRSLDGLVSALGLPAPGHAALRASLIPMSGPDAALGKGSFYLVGDAAGMADRLTGEGISHAVESGFLAAEAIAGGWSRRRIARETGRGCAGIVRQSGLARHLIYSRTLQPMAMRRLGAKDKFYSGYWDLVSGRVDYLGLMRRFVRSS